jgi:flagellar motor component MotA
MGYYLKGIAPILAIESSRRMIPPHLRPSSKELEESIKAAKAGGAPANG